MGAAEELKLKAEIARLRSLRNQGELNEELKDPVRAARMALIGIEIERDELREELRIANLQVEQLRTEIAKLKGEPFTCGHDPQYIGGACAACHATWIDRAQKAELQVEAFRKALEECACSQHLHEASDARTGCHGPCPVCTAMSAIGLKLPKQWRTEQDEREGLATIEALKSKLGWTKKKEAEGKGVFCLDHKKVVTDGIGPKRAEKQEDGWCKSEKNGDRCIYVGDHRERPHRNKRGDRWEHKA
jgi:hypothetical protein